MSTEASNQRSREHYAQALDYWGQAFADCESVTFPSSPPSGEQVVPDTTLTYCFPKLQQNKSIIPTTTIIRTAWSVIVARITATEDVVFGVTVPRDSRSTVLPLRIPVTWDQTLESFLRTIEKRESDLALFGDVELTEIVSTSVEAERACQFQTVLSTNDKECGKNLPPDAHKYALSLEFDSESGTLSVAARFHSAVIDSTNVQNLLERLEHVLLGLEENVPRTAVRNISMMSQRDLDSIWGWNATVAHPAESCVHNIVEERAAQHPDTLAVCAWDGELSYGKLNALSTTLAAHLTTLGVGAGAIVPICLEKSMYTTIALLAVLKTGAAFVLLDPSLPAQRLQTMVNDTNATISLGSEATNRELMKEMGTETITVNAQSLSNLTQQHQSTMRPLTIPPSSTMYIIYTSGSTGAPKGAIITHQNHATALESQATKLGLGPGSRIYDFSAYSFDIAIFNTFAALTLGGCLCVPSDHERQNKLSESITSLNANFVYLTPTVARQLSPENTPTLNTLAFIGEALHLKDIRPWWNKVQIVNSYGPSECTTAATLNTEPTSLEGLTSIGKGVGSVTWVVDPEDPHVLLPPGSVGELLLEGPLVGRGYLNDDHRTSELFIRNPPWLTDGYSGVNGRQNTTLYKTGDLVEYAADGRLNFVGRKDTQVKIRGHRVELGEVEHTFHECMPSAGPVIAEIIATGSGKSASSLAVFIETANATTSHDEQDAVKMTPINPEVKMKLSRTLPTHMVPTLCFTISHFPMTPSGKLHRKQLRVEGQAVYAQNWRKTQVSNDKKRQPQADVQRQLQHIWSGILELDSPTIGLDDSFFDLGGDSLGAMKVISEARKIGFELTVSDIFEHLTLEKISAKATYIDEAESTLQTPPFSLLNVPDIEDFSKQVSAQYGLGPTTLKDAYACTPLQEGLLSLTAKSPGDYIMQGVLEISSQLNVVAFQSAWEKVIRAVDILRTTIVQHDQLGLLQLVLQEGNPSWIQAATGLEEYLAADKQRAMDLGHPLSRYALVGDTTESPKWFVWTVHHALFDEWSLSLILDSVTEVYLGTKATVQLPAFQPFIKYIKDRSEDESMEQYWRQYLADCECPAFPALPTSVDRPVTDEVREHSLLYPGNHHTSITTSTIIRAAWAMVTSSMINSDDVVFGATVSGRSAPVPYVEAIPAPTIATVPIRLRVTKKQGVSDYLQDVQQQTTQMIPFEQMGLHRIAKLGQDAQQATNFQTLLVIQPNHDSSGEDRDVLGQWNLGNEQQSFNTYALILEIQLSKGKAMVARASFDSRVTQPWLVQRLLERLELVIGQLDNAGPHQTLSDIQIATHGDLEQMWGWNQNVPATSDLCIHHVLERQALLRPDAPAICAWDGEATYSEMDRLSTSLAMELGRLGVEQGGFIPLYFEKSLWTTIAMLGVLKAGNAFLLLDPSLPENRLQDIVKQTKSTLIISSASNEDASSVILSRVLTIGHAFFANLDAQSQGEVVPMQRSISSSSTAYVIFTSGSTGTPKGVVVTHQNVTSAVPEHVKGFGYTEESRIYDFASYSFGAALNNVFVALISGGCLCVPSDNDRRSNLAGSIDELKANAVLLTPSVAEHLSPENVPTLRTLIFGGEAVRQKDVQPWWGKVRVLTAYGSSEVTTVATVNVQGTSNIDEVSQIGTGAGGVTWVVDPDDHQRLLPPGSVGELILEGPLVGSGYLGDQQKTEAAFVENPPWLLTGFSKHPGRHGRLYKTGDLVTYNQNGNLSYIGRKDAQVKIRGQRVELGEVEFRVQECFPEATQTVVEVISPQDKESGPTLAAFVVLNQTGESSDSSDEEHSAENLETRPFPVSTEIEDKLSKNLPSYMIPTVLFSMDALPMTATGKTNRKRLREAGSSFSTKELTDLRTAGATEKKQPRTELEHQLHMIWSRVLNIDQALIGVDDSFFKLGGDSISAMQVASSARGYSIVIGVADILRQKTISNLARTARTDRAHELDRSARWIADLETATPELSPIQRLYFQLQDDPKARFDQSFYLRLREGINPDLVSAGLETLVRRHGALRTRFTQTSEGKWEQHIAEDSSNSVCFKLVAPSKKADYSIAITEARDALNIATGPIFSAVLFEGGADYQTLFLTIHHLVIDLVSWRVLLQELETLLTVTEPRLAAPHSLEFSHWSSMQAHYLQEANIQPVPSTSRKDRILLDYWGMQNNSNLKSGATIKRFALDEKTSSLILDSCNDAFSTRPLELMVAALAYSFREVFHDRQLPLVFSEGHGREPWDESLDITTTIGWFSTIYPIEIEPDVDASLIEFIQRTKDSVRALTNNGWTDFTSRFASETNANQFAEEFPVEIMFNYAGLYQGLERDDGLFEQISLPYAEKTLSSDSAVRRFTLFDFDLQVERGCLTGLVEYHDQMQHGGKILNWIDAFQSTLERIAQTLPTMPQTWTLSDFPTVFGSYNEIEETCKTELAQIGVEPAQVEDIFPCAPLQQGILLAQAKEPVTYQRWCDLDIELDANDDGQVDIERLVRAWEVVVGRHPLLRAVLVDNFSGSHEAMHIVLKAPKPSILCDTSKRPSESHVFDKNELQHRIHFYSIEGRLVRARFYSNHAIIDGFSQSLLCHDLQKAYADGYVEPASGSYNDFVKYLKQQPHENGVAFWTQYLSEVEPCQFPVANDTMPDSRHKPFLVPNVDVETMREFSTTHDVTVATIIKVAWSLVLGVYTGTSVPCFGNLSSGRDIPVKNAEDIFGPFIGMIPCCVHLDDSSKQVLETLRDVQSDYLASMPFQHFPLSDVLQLQGLGSHPLFNTIFSYQKIEEGITRAKDGGLNIRTVDNFDPTEVC